MICPNCGRELPDTARVCPDCSAVQRVFRRRQAEAAIPEGERRVPVARSVLPDEEAAQRRREAPAGAASVPAARRAPEETPRRAPSGSRMPDVPVGLQRQADRERTQVRHVRRAPDHIRRKLDAGPALPNPPIYQRSRKRLKRVLFLTLLLTIFVVLGGGCLLMESEGGQRMMAQWGWSYARTDAYVTLGRDLYNQAYYERAMDALSVAVEREPDNVDALVLMAQTYTELGDIEQATAIYESLINDIAPAHPSAYRNLIRIYQQQGYNAEALELMRVAAQNAVGTQEFDVMLREFTPTAPTLSHQAGRYPEEFDLTITIPEGETVYYSVDGTDPSEAGLVYTANTRIHIPEGKMTVKVIGFDESGTPSEQITANYTVIIQTPAAPKANVQSGRYTYSPKVSLRPGGETKAEQESIEAIYYTLDGRAPTTESTLYDGNPIVIPLGDTQLRAIAVAKNGKISYEMQVTYKVTGNLKNVFRSADTFKNMELYKTGYKTFTRAWGEPQSETPLSAEEGYSPEMKSFEAVYDWGTARFLQKSEDASPVLYALDTTNASMTGPRSTKIGMAAEDVMAKFQDLGRPALDDEGNRLLYNRDSAGHTFGTYRREEDGSYAIHYYYPVDEKHTIFVELSYYLDEKGKVARIVWQRYRSELPTTAEE